MEGEEEGEEDNDEVCRELKLAWEALKMADARSLHKTVELEGAGGMGYGWNWDGMDCGGIGIGWNWNGG